MVHKNLVFINVQCKLLLNNAVYHIAHHIILLYNYEIKFTNPPLVDNVLAVILRIVYQHESTILQSLVSGFLLLGLLGWWGRGCF